VTTDFILRPPGLWFLNLQLRHEYPIIPVAAALVPGSVLTRVVTPGMAQISQNNGSSQQENQTSSMGTSPGSSASTAHESHKPQAKDAAATHAARPLVPLC
jgi:hypothetical protein